MNRHSSWNVRVTRFFCVWYTNCHYAQRKSLGHRWENLHIKFMRTGTKISNLWASNINSDVLLQSKIALSKVQGQEKIYISSQNKIICRWGILFSDISGLPQEQMRKSSPETAWGWKPICTPTPQGDNTLSNKLNKSHVIRNWMRRLGTWSNV